MHKTNSNVLGLFLAFFFLFLLVYFGTIIVENSIALWPYLWVAEEIKQEAQPRPFPLYEEIIFRRANCLPQLTVRQGKLCIGTKARLGCAALR